MQFNAETFITLQAYKSGAGSGFATESVSPLTTTAARDAMPNAFRSGMVKRVGLFVTIPHGDPHESRLSSKSSIPSNSVVSTQIPVR